MRFYVNTDQSLEKLETAAYEVGLDRENPEEKGGLLEAREECRAMEVYRDANGFFIMKGTK
jgi:hypothetical protein